mgnify:CR=1 FL=1
MLRLNQSNLMAYHYLARPRCAFLERLDERGGADEH